MISLDVLENDDDTDTQVVKWVAKFPYPMYPRVYIYIRRKLIDLNAGKIIVCSRALDENSYPDDSKHVRVTWYRSSMLIQAHKSFDDVSFPIFNRICKDVIFSARIGLCFDIL